MLVGFSAKVGTVGSGETYVVSPETETVDRKVGVLEGAIRMILHATIPTTRNIIGKINSLRFIGFPPIWCQGYG